MSEPGSQDSTAPPERRLAFYLIPNIFTSLALLAGFYSVIKSIEGDYVFAGWAIVVAALLDMLDGRIARLINAQSEFGAQYDSLSDLICFGLAPAVLTFEWSLNELGRFGFSAGFFFCACAAVRLARFNVAYGKADPNYYIGLPAPMAGITAAAAVLSFGEGPTLGNALLIMLLLLLLAATMVSNILYYSFKNINVRARLNGPLMLLAALLAVSMAALILLEFRAGGLLLVGLAYLFMGYFRMGRLLLRDYREYRNAGKGNLYNFFHAWVVGRFWRRRKDET